MRVVIEININKLVKMLGVMESKFIPLHRLKISDMLNKPIIENIIALAMVFYAERHRIGSLIAYKHTYGKGFLYF